MSMLNFLVFTSLKSIRITSRSQKIISVELYQDFRDIWISQNESSVKKSPFQSAFPIVRYVCKFTLITYFDYIAVTVFYQQESCYFRKSDGYIPDPSQCFVPKIYTVLKQFSAVVHLACLHYIILQSCLSFWNYVIITPVFIWENVFIHLNLFQNLILWSFRPVLI